MIDILPTLKIWVQEDKPFALARVISTWGSAPRRVGATMLISHDSEIAGSVSGGCIEGSVIEAAVEAISSGSSRLLEYGVSDETAWSVGLSCGGSVRVFVTPWDVLTASVDGPKLLRSVESGRPGVLVSLLRDGADRHTLISADPVSRTIPDTDDILPHERIEAALRARNSELVRKVDSEWFLHVLAPRPRLLIVGASDIAVRLVALAARLNFETVVVDPRAVFTQTDRFDPAPDRLVCDWPQEVIEQETLDEDTFAVLLTHDPKIDDPALHVLLKSPVAYVGALGGARTQKKRRERLRDSGFSTEAVGRIHGPVGLDIDAATPAEIALSILAEVVAVKNRRQAASQALPSRGAHTESGSARS